jgi:hypothetical protein
MLFWVVLPPIILLIPTVIFNDSVKTLMHLYPLMIALAALIVFFAFYLFRAVSISKKEIKCIGPFSSKELVKIKEGRTLLITIQKKRRLKLELFGSNDDGEGSYEWLKNEEPTEINLFRATVNGGVKTAEKIIGYFKNDKTTISAEETDGIKTFRISF